MEPQTQNSVPASRLPAILKLLLSLLIVIAAAALALKAYERSRLDAEPLFETRFTAMGTVCQVKLWAPKEAAPKAAEAAKEAIAQVESVCSVFDKASELSKLNETAFDAPFVCSPLLWEVLGHSRRFNAISNGAFDVTIKPLMALWGFYRKRGELPSQEEIDEARKTVGMDKLVFDDAARSVKFSVKGMGIDLGGVAKGFALDKAVERLLALGVKRGMVNIGGNIRCLPLPPPGADAYVVGVRNPFAPVSDPKTGSVKRNPFSGDGDSLCGSVKLLNASIGTSGDYERYVVIDGRHFTHMMNPKTGLPVENMIAVTVVTPLGVESDGLSKAPFINGPDAAKEICSRIPATSALVIRRDPENPADIIMDRIGPIWGSVSLPSKPEKAE